MFMEILHQARLSDATGCHWSQWSGLRIANLNRKEIQTGQLRTTSSYGGLGIEMKFELEELALPMLQTKAMHGVWFEGSVWILRACARAS